MQMELRIRRDAAATGSTDQTARTVTGGTPFAFNDRSDAHPFGVFKEVEGGGRIIVMGDGMVSLYMTSWEGVKDYQCQELMQAAFRWLLK